MAYIHLDSLTAAPYSINGYIYLDAAGKPCGKGWISASYNCSGDKRAYTKQHRQGDRDKAARRIRDERRKAKGYREEVKTIDDFVKNVDVLQDEISARLANLEYDYDQTDPQPKNKRGKKQKEPEDWETMKLSDIEKQAEEGQARMYKNMGMSEEDAKREAAKNMQRMKNSMPLKGEYDELEEGDIKNLDLNEGAQTVINGITHEVIGGELIPIDGDEVFADLLKQEEADKQRKQQQQAQKQAEKRRKAAERKAKAADKKIGQLDKKMSKAKSPNDELKLANEKINAKNERQSALESIIQATLAAQEAQQVGGKSSVVPFSGQSMRDRRNLEFQLREELFKLTDLGIDFRSEASTRAFKAKKAELDRKLAETQEKFRQMDIERLNIMWNKKSPKDRKLDSFIQYAAECKSRFDSLYPSRQIAIPAHTSLLGYFDALSAMADGNLSAIGRYSVKRDRSIRRDSQGLGYDLVDGVYVLESSHQDKYIRI